MKQHQDYLIQAIQLAKENKLKAGRPFGAVIVMNDKIIASGVNAMLGTSDPSSHAELEAIRVACKKLAKLTLDGCTIYASGHPCPMCLAAIAMTNIEAVYYAFDNNDGAPYGYSSELTYKKLGINRESVSIPLVRLNVGIDASEVYE